MSELIVADDEYVDYKQKVVTLVDAVEDKLGRYLTILSATRASAITGGEVAVRLDGYIEATQSLLKDTMRVAGYNVADKALTFLEDIDVADERLYGEL
ncbi:MAG: hypothetical protein LBP24_01315 [Coriobacteriales bacterium]|jgi:hypothetical protein|nr:hypothetical protein [Coriobacteriales bacterium]